MIDPFGHRYLRLDIPDPRVSVLLSAVMFVLEQRVNYLRLRVVQVEIKKERAREASRARSPESVPRGSGVGLPIVSHVMFGQATILPGSQSAVCW